jgi:hypothetical protein
MGENGRHSPRDQSSPHLPCQHQYPTERGVDRSEKGGPHSAVETMCVRDFCAHRREHQQCEKKLDGTATARPTLMAEPTNERKKNVSSLSVHAFVFHPQKMQDPYGHPELV